MQQLLIWLNKSTYFENYNEQKNEMLLKKASKGFSKKKGTYKIDLYNMAKGQVLFSDLKKAISKKKKKKVKNQNTFLMGFDPGFTKMLIRLSIVDKYLKLKKYTKVQVLLGESNEKIKKKVKKKIVAKPSVKKKKKKKKKMGETPAKKKKKKKKKK